MEKQAVHKHPRIQGGVPVFTGTRVPVKNLFDYLEYQQNLRELPLTVIALVARNNTFETLQSLMPEVLHRLADIEPYTLSRVGD